MVSRVNGAKLNLAMRELRPVKIGKETLYIDAKLHESLMDVLELTGNSTVETVEYLNGLKLQIEEIQKGLESL